MVKPRASAKAEEHRHGVIVGSGALTFRWVSGWGRLPAHVSLGDAPGVAVDSQDRLFVLQRGNPPVLIFDRNGNFEGSWGEGIFKRPHGIFIAPDDSVYCVDDEGQTVRRFTPDGQLGLEIARPDQSAVTGYRRGNHRSVLRSAPPFCYPTDSALSPDPEHILVTDGYGNARVHRFDQKGNLVSSFGEPGERPAQFIIPHGILVDHDGTMFVSDRENERIQVFDASGKFLSAWNDVHCPNNVALGPDGLFYVAELGRTIQGSAGAKRVVEDAIRPRITARERDGSIVAAWEAPEPDTPYFAPHGIALDSYGDIYVGEVSASNSGGLAPLHPSLSKFIRL